MLFNIVTNIISVVFAGKHNHFKNDFLTFFKKYAGTWGAGGLAGGLAGGDPPAPQGRDLD